MKRSLQEVIELIIFGLIALVIGTGLLWVMGWLLGLVGIVFKFIAGIIWVLLRYILPVAIVAGIIFFVVRFFANRQSQEKAVSDQASTEQTLAKDPGSVEDSPKVVQEIESAETATSDQEAATSDKESDQTSESSEPTQAIENSEDAKPDEDKKEQ